MLQLVLQLFAILTSLTSLRRFLAPLSRFPPSGPGARHPHARVVSLRGL